METLLAGTLREQLLRSVTAMNYAYMLYQAERPRNRAEQIEDNRRRGELAAALIRPWRRDRKKHVTPTPRRGQVTPAA